MLLFKSILFLIVIQLMTVATLGWPAKHSSDITTLQLVQLIYRHGDRTPFANAFPNDSYNNLQHWPEGFGQLTKEGKMMQYNLGQYLRMRYSGFLKKSYNKDEIYVRSSDLDRTIMSAQANLAGLYPLEEKRDRWNKNIAWEPIPVHTLHASMDNKMNFIMNCPKYKLLLQKLLESERLKKLNRDHKDLYEYLTKHTGRNVMEFPAVAEIFDTLFIQQTHGYELPEWTIGIFPDKMIHLAVLPFELISGSEELSKLRSSPLLHDMIYNMDVHLNYTVLTELQMKNFPKAKLYMNSGHDTTVTTIMSALGIYDNKHIPEYASVLIIELHRDGELGKPFVKVFYRNDTSSAPTQMSIPGCISSSGKCDYSKFKQVLAPRTLNESEWTAECSVNGLPPEDDEGTMVESFPSAYASTKEQIRRKIKSIGNELYSSYWKPFAQVFF